MYQQQNSSCFFERKNPQKMKVDRNSLNYFDQIQSSSLLEISNKTGSVFMLNQKDLYVIDPKQLEQILNTDSNKEINDEYDEFDFEDEDHKDLTIAKLSPCETRMAIVNSSNVIIIYLPDFLTQQRPKAETNFEIEGQHYTYLEWAPLNDIYCASINDNPLNVPANFLLEEHFLTLDSSGKLRIHWISPDEMLSNLDEHFRCATFSLDGAIIYAINYHHEVFMIDPLNAQIISKRKMYKLQTTSTMIPIKMLQIDPEIMVIGSLYKSAEGQNENLKPHLMFLSGDLLDPQSELQMFSLKMHSSETMRQNKLPDFCFLHVKERQLLFFSHTESSRVQILRLEENGDLEQFRPIDLERGTVRGFGIYNGVFPEEEKEQMVEVDYQNRKIGLPTDPRILVLDSQGYLHHFHYIDKRFRYSSMLVNPVKVEVLRNEKLTPTVIANRSVILDQFLNPEQSTMNMKKRNFFKYQGCCKSISSFGLTLSNENADNPYMLDYICDIETVLAVYGKRSGYASLNKLEQMLKLNPEESRFDENSEDRGDIRMLRVSDCKYFVAIVHEASICIQKTEIFLNVDVENQQQRKTDAEFTLLEAKYAYVEWPPLNHAYIENTYFLTRDDQGILRIHYINEKAEQVLGQGEVFRCATFSLDGRYIYAINEKQEICQIDLQDTKILMKRMINELSGAISSHIQQLTPLVFALGSMIKTENEDQFNPQLYTIYGDISDPNIELRIKGYEMPFLKTFEHKKPPIFRFLFVRERQVLLFGHSGSNEIRALHFAFNGSEIEIEKISLGNMTLRGIIFLKKRAEAKEMANRHPVIKKKKPRGREMTSRHHEGFSKSPQFLILDSKGYLHHFHYSDGNYCVPMLPLFTNSLSIEKFLEKRELLQARLIPKERSRARSQHQKLSPSVHKKKRSKSQIQIRPSEIKMSREKIIENLKGNKKKTQNLSFSPKSFEKVFPVYGDSRRKEMLFLNKSESDITFKVEGQEFPAHKSILSERCKFFKNMFSSGMSESYSTVLEIPDTKASVFKIFLTYVYLGTILVTEELAVDFYELSERYMIDELKESCERYLCDILTLDNCFKIFETVCLYDAIYLKQQVLKFFKTNLDKITQRKDIKNLPKWSFIHIKKLLWQQISLEKLFEPRTKMEKVEYALKKELLRLRYKPEETAFVVTLTNFPSFWDDDMLKRILKQMHIKFKSFKVEESTRALFCIVGLREAMELYSFDGLDFDGFVITTEIRISLEQSDDVFLDDYEDS